MHMPYSESIAACSNTQSARKHRLSCSTPSRNGISCSCRLLLLQNHVQAIKQLTPRACCLLSQQLQLMYDIKVLQYALSILLVGMHDIQASKQQRQGSKQTST